MGDANTWRYGDDPELEAVRRRSRVRVGASVVLATVVSAPMIIYGVVLVACIGWIVGWMWQGSPIATIVVVTVVVAVMVTVRNVDRDARRMALTQRGAHLPDIRPVPSDHPASDQLVRLCLLAGVAVPDLERVSTPGLNACVVVDDGARVIRLTDAALAELSPPQLDAVLAHELFHLEHGDARSAARWEKAADLGDGGSDWVEHVVRAGVRQLLRARELAADRAAVLLTGQPSAMAEAIEICSASRAAIPQQDLRTSWASAFVAEDGEAAGSLATHPTLQERLEVVARAAAQLGKR